MRLCALFLIAAAVLAASLARALEYPKSAISLIVPAAAGGGTDLTARLFAKYAKDFLGQSLVVVNVGGAAGFNGCKRVHDAAPDGYTVLFFHNNGLILNKISGVAPYSLEGFEAGPRTNADAATGFFVNASSPWKTMKDFIDAAKAKDGGISTATEVGGYTYYMILSLQERFGIKLKIVDVGSNSEKTTALLGGHIDSMPNSFTTNQNYVKSGDFRFFGFVAATRSTAFPDVPTVMEQGLDYSYPGYQIGIFFPLNTPKEIIAKFDEAAKKVSEHPAYQADIKKLGFSINYLPSGENHKDLLEMQAMYEKLAASIKK
jgi:tripartite-type tricarboxylate transporter receptor subunit TctC